MLRNFMLVFFLFLCSKVFAQEILNDSLTGPEVLVESSRYKLFSAGTNKTTFDSSAITENYSNNLTEILSSRSAVYMKDYGANSLATISFRGTNANHTQVTWNGFPINSSANGVVDFSNIPVSQIDRISLVHGGSSSLYGSAAIGGSVQLDNVPTWEKGTSVMLSSEAGSFDTWRHRGKIITGNKSFESNTNFYYNKAQNNYPFINTTLEGSPVSRLANASLMQFGLMQSFHFKAGKSNRFSVGVWYQNSDRNLPPLMFQADSKASQKDSSLRTYIKWVKKFVNGSFLLRSAYFSEYLRYVDPKTNIDSKSLVNKNISESEYRHTFLDKKITANFGTGITYAVGKIKEFEGTRTQFRGTVFGGIKYISKRDFKLDVTIRKEFSPGYQPPITPSIGVEKKIDVNSHNLFIKAKASRNFRLPTLNERFWMPGGNANLQPELGWSEEAGLRHVKSFKNESVMETEFTAFTSIIDNWIQWSPAGGSAYIWTPVNLKKVWARGFEVKSNATFNIKQLKIDFSSSYAYTVSTNLQVYSDDQKSTLGKQLIYVPYNNLNFSLKTEIRKYFINYNQVMTGFRFTSAENDEYVNGFVVGNMYVGKTIKIVGCEFYLQLKINNIWNVQYQSVAWAPMPGRSYYLTLQFQFNNRK